MKNIFVTGADGYIGRKLVCRYLEEKDCKLHLWVRAADSEEFEAKKKYLAGQFTNLEERAKLYYGDLVSDDPFGSVDLKEVDQFIHSAAVTDFNVSKEKALQVNIGGTRKAMDFASRLRSLNQFVLMSSVYAAGLKRGSIPEDVLLDREGFSNFYEWSKWASEDLLVQKYSHLPWKIVRLATVICDNAEGKVDQYNAFHNTLKLFYYGLLSLIPGDPKTTLYFLTGEFSAHALLSILKRGKCGKVYQIVHRKKESVSLGELVDIAFDVFGQSDDFKIRRILKPLFSDAEAFQLLEEGVGSFTSGIVNQAVSSVSPFARQLFYEKEFANQNTLAVLEGYELFDFGKIARKTCEYLVQTKWGRPAVHVER